MKAYHTDERHATGTAALAVMNDESSQRQDGSAINNKNHTDNEKIIVSRVIPLCPLLLTRMFTISVLTLRCSSSTPSPLFSNKCIDGRTFTKVPWVKISFMSTFLHLPLSLSKTVLPMSALVPATVQISFELTLNI
jgi:hypothetical protein